MINAISAAGVYFEQFFSSIFLSFSVCLRNDLRSEEPVGRPVPFDLMIDERFHFQKGYQLLEISERTA